MTPADRLLDAMRPTLAAAPEGPVGVAVSGGSDSVALLLLTNIWAKAAGRRVAAITVDHGLRPESAGEVAAVAALCRAQGIPHATRRWQGWDGRGNLQGTARQARHRLIADWAQGAGIQAVVLGHTRDDQAETFLMRLARGSGVDGLAAMRPVRSADGLLWLRPMLGLAREHLRVWLTDQGVGWIDDPSNADTRFDRVRARAALPPLADIGVDAARLASTAARLGRAREALETAALETAGDCLAPTAFGDLVLAWDRLARAPEEIRLRVLAGALCWVSGAVYRPRLAALEDLMGDLVAGRVGHGRTLHGCVLRRRAGGIVIRREVARMSPPVPVGQVWDGRWRLAAAPEQDGLRLGAVGLPGLEQCPAWRDCGAARESAIAAPALWAGDRLVAAPLTGAAASVEFRHVASVFDPWGATLLR